MKKPCSFSFSKLYTHNYTSIREQIIRIGVLDKMQSIIGGDESGL